MNDVNVISHLNTTPNQANEVAVFFSIGLADFEYDSEPTQRRYSSNSQSIAIIYENTSNGTAIANAHLLAYLLKFIEPVDTHDELKNTINVPLLRDRNSPFESLDEYKSYLEALGYGTGTCGFIGEVFGHALTDNLELSTTTTAPKDYMDEFTRSCSYCAFTINSVNTQQQLNELMIMAMREPKRYPGFILPTHLVDCSKLGTPLINPNWLSMFVELATGEVVPNFDFCNQIPIQ